MYTFSFEPNPNWSSFYASGREIWQYIKDTTQKYGLDERVRLNSKVVSTVWDDQRAKWLVEVQTPHGIEHDVVDLLINGSGLLNKRKWPDIKGLDTFKGQLLHSAAWSDTDWTGKRVAVIGNGASALQIVPQMQPAAAKIVNYVRNPTWVAANFAAELTPEGKNFAYSEAQKARFRDDADAFYEMRHEMEHTFNHFFYTLFKDSPQQRDAAAATEATMRERLGHDEELCAKLIPSWHLGCRRLSPGDGYLEALRADNAEVVFGEVDEINERGIGDREYDVIVCATGFDVSFAPSWDMGGRACRGEAYFGVCTPHLPNYFMFNGPNSPVGHGNLLMVMEWAAEWMLKWCDKMAREDIRCVCG